MIRWADPERMERAVAEHVAELKAAPGRVRRVIWYGSWVSGRPTPTSDVDLCVVVSADDRRPRERVADYLPSRFPTGVDVVVLTEDELDALSDRAPECHRAIASGRDMVAG